MTLRICVHRAVTLRVSSSTTIKTKEKTFARLLSAVGLCFSMFLHFLLHCPISSLPNFFTLLSAKCHDFN